MSKRLSSILRILTVLSLLAGLVVVPSGSALAYPGDLDTTFATTGYIVSSLGSDATRVNTTIKDIVVQPDGKIIAGGGSLDGGYLQGEWILKRYNPDGSLDTSFDTDGWTTTSFGGGWADLSSLALLPDGRIVAAGTYFYVDGGIDYRVFALARYCPDGSLDTGTNCAELTPKFGTDGKVTTEAVVPGNTTSVIQSMALQDDGKIVVAGYTSVTANVEHIWALARYNTDGSLDPGFDGDGLVITDFSDAYEGSNEIYSVAIQDSGKIVAAGFSNPPGDEPEFALARYCPDGSLDTGGCGGSAFGVDGKTTTKVGNYDVIRSMAFQADGRIVVAGMSMDTIPNSYFALARYTADGILDGSFSDDGILAATIDETILYDTAFAVAVQADGKIVAAGESWSEWSGSTSRLSVARFTPEGEFDLSFGIGGKVFTPEPGGTTAWFNTVEIQPNGKILAGGKSNIGLTAYATLVRYDSPNPDPTPPSVTTISIPNAAIKVGDTVTTTITVESDTDTYTLVSGTIGGFALGSLSKSNDTTYTAQFTVTNGGTDVAAASDIPVSLVLRDSASNQNTAYTTAISQGGDPIDANRPSIGSIDLSAASDSGSSSTDNITNVTQPVFTGTAEADSTVSVYVDDILDTTASANGLGAWTYTPTSSLAGGAHTIKATAADAAGNVSDFSPSTSFTVDTTPPAAPVVLTPANSSSTGDSTPTYSGTAEPNSTVTILVDGSPVGTPTADGAGNWSFTSGTALPDGPHTVEATATDTAGNTSADSNTNTFTVDTTPPAAPVVTTPANGSTTGDNTPTYSGTAEAGSTVTVIVDGAVIGTTAANGGGSWSFTPVVPLAGGPHTVKDTATDAVGNVSAESNTNTFTVDTTPPAAPVVTNPTNGTTTSDNTPTVTGTAEASSTVTVIVDGAVVGLTTADAPGNWSFTLGSALADGPHTAKATATDTVGNTSTDSNTNTFTVDMTPPASPVVLTPANGSTTSDNTPTYSGTAEAGSTVTVIVDGSTVGTTTADGAGAWSLTPVTPLADGPHTVRTTATDAAGNTSANSNTNTFTVDTTPPAAPVVLTPADGSTTSDNTPAYSGTAEAGSTVTVNVDGTPVGTTTANGSGDWAFTLVVPLADGPHTAKATATDAAGNTSPDSNANTFTVDTTPPATPVVTSPADGSFTNDTTPAISGAAEANSTVTVSIDGSEVGTTSAGPTGDWTFNLDDALDEGSHTVRAKAADAAGNVGPDSGTNTFTVDTVRPGVELSSTAPNPTKLSSLPVVVTFTKSVTGFEAGDLVTENATVSSFAGSGASYTFDLVPSGQGAVRVSVPEGAAQDAAGNLSQASGLLQRLYDSIQPQIQGVVRAGATPTKETLVHFTVTFSEPVSGVGVDDFSLTTTGVSGAAIAGLSGTGSSYTVEVNTGTGTGSIRLDFVDDSGTDDKTKDAVGNLLAVSGAGWDSSVYAGEVYTVDKVAPDVEDPPAPEPLDDGGLDPYVFTVTFGDDQGIDPDSFGDGNVQVTGPGGFNRPALFVSTTSTASGYTVTYQLDAPEDGWSSIGAGTYEIKLIANQVRDLSGNYLPAQTLTTMEKEQYKFFFVFIGAGGN